MTVNNQQIGEILDESYRHLSTSLVNLLGCDPPVHFIKAVIDALHSLDICRQNIHNQQQEDTESQYRIRALRRQGLGFSGAIGTVELPPAVREEIEKLVTEIIDQKLNSQPEQQSELSEA